MNWMDMYYDAEAGYLYSLDAAALMHETRASAWYASGLLARNEGDDAEQAIKIIQNVIAGQHKNVTSQWYLSLFLSMSFSISFSTTLPEKWSTSMAQYARFNMLWPSVEFKFPAG